MAVNTALNSRLKGEAKVQFIILAFAVENEKNKIFFYTDGDPNRRPPQYVRSLKDSAKVLGLGT
jgi:hypothetical protein